MSTNALYSHELSNMRQRALRGGHNYDPASIRRPFDCLSKVIEVKVMQPAIRGRAEEIYSFGLRFSGPQQVGLHGRNVGC